MSVISSSIGGAVMQYFIKKVGYLTVLEFNCDMENDSDDVAIHVLLPLYGHLNGTDNLFIMLQRDSAANESYKFSSTHPLTEKMD
jgi:hypothetical protein